MRSTRVCTPRAAAAQYACPIWMTKSTDKPIKMHKQMACESEGPSERNNDGHGGGEDDADGDDGEYSDDDVGGGN